jgi:hypothetical protein
VVNTNKNQASGNSKSRGDFIMNIGSTRQKINIMFYIGFIALFLTTIYTGILTILIVNISKRVKGMYRSG